MSRKKKRQAIFEPFVHAEVCRYCDKAVEESARTIDHVVPRWALRLFPDSALPWVRPAKVTACFTCNHAKGPMPAAVYWELRQQKSPNIKGMRLKWEKIVLMTKPKSRVFDLRAVMAMRGEIVREFSRPIPAPPKAALAVEIRQVAAWDAIDFVRGR